jgi:hypothetical protein
MTQLCLLGLSGSLRRASNSTAVLRALQDALAPGRRYVFFRCTGSRSTTRMMTPKTHRSRCAPCVRPLRRAMVWS